MQATRLSMAGGVVKQGVWNASHMVLCVRVVLHILKDARASNTVKRGWRCS